MSHARGDRPSIRVRAAEPGDEALLLEMIRELAAYELLSDQVVACEEDLRSALFDRSSLVGAAIGELDGEPAGFALWYANFSTFTGRPGIHLEDIFVKPAARNRGLGFAIFRWVARTAMQRGAPRLDWSVLDWNEDAHRFYASLGGSPLDEWRNYRLEGEALEKLSREG